AFGGFGGREATAERGADVEADILVTLEEALHGSTRTVSLRRAGSNKVENYQVKIPRGVHEGQRIRLAGQGEAGARGGKSGDLYLVAQIDIPKKLSEREREIWSQLAKLHGG